MPDVVPQPDAAGSGRRLTLSWRDVLYWAALALLAFLYLRQMLAYSPTNDPDPDGYVTYANHLRENGTFLDFRRLPGYPLFILAVDHLSPAGINIDVFFAQIALSIGLFLVMTLMVAHYIGKSASLVFAAILAIQSLLGYLSTVMLADFLSALCGQLLLLIAVVLFKVRGWRIAIVLAGFFISTFVGVAVHSSLFWIAICFCIGGLLVWSADRLLPWKFVSEQFRRTGPTKLVGLVLTAIAANIAVFATIVPHPPDRPSSYERFYSLFSTYYMALCLPPGDEPADVTVQQAKADISAELGYPAERSRYPAFGKAWNPAVAKHPEINSEFWRERALKAPLSFLGCAYNELQSRYHDLIKQFSPFSSKSELVNLYRPPFTNEIANKMYWMTGIYAPTMRDEAGTLENASAFAVEFFRVVGVIGLVFGGAFVMARRYPEFALTSLIGSLGWLAAASMQLVLDARYLIVLAPFIYLCQAVALWWIFSSATKLVASLLPGKKPTRAPA